MATLVTELVWLSWNIEGFFLKGLDSVGNFSATERVIEHSKGFVHILSS